LSFRNEKATSQLLPASLAMPTMVSVMIVNLSVKRQAAMVMGKIMVFAVSLMKRWGTRMKHPRVPRPIILHSVDKSGPA